MSEKYTSPCTMPTDSQRELLVCLIEECQEVSQRACKSHRFGIEEVQVTQHKSNKVRLSEEIGDLLAVLSLLLQQGLIDQIVVDNQIDIKIHKLQKYLQYIPEKEIK
jgi:NTP pyrophosphatase (non-canonical NTP hydrolase)